MSNSRIAWRLPLIAFALALLAGCSEAPKTKGSEAGMRLLTEPQYRQIIADVFGEQITIGGTFDPLVRTNGLLTVGASAARVTPAGLEQLDRMARSIAAQVISEENRDFLLPCTPADARAPDDKCAAQFFGTTGRLLLRRALTDEEVASLVRLANAGARDLGGFHEGLASALAGLLVSPEFLFVIEQTEPDPKRDGALRLDGYSKATRLSFFLWGSAPDDELLRAAESGELHSKSGLAKQVDRMLESQRLEQGLRLFFDDMLTFESIGRLEKDAIIYPAFSTAVALDAREQTLRTLMHLLLDEEADYRDIFTTRKTFISNSLGRIYRIPVSRPDGGWMEYEFPEDDPRLGIATHISFTALHSHAGRSSPTLRGKAIREILLCQRVPDPPGTVDFSAFNDPESPAHTARERLNVHSIQPACAGCHKLTDPVGLGMEHIDGAGQLRTSEGGYAIDASGSLDGFEFNDVAGIGPALRENVAAPACLVNRLYSYATARVPARNERKYLKSLEQQFAEEGYRVPALLRHIALDEAMYAVKAPSTRTARVNEPVTGDPS